MKVTDEDVEAAWRMFHPRAQSRPRIEIVRQALETAARVRAARQAADRRDAIERRGR